jgi:hypothetical protein
MKEFKFFQKIDKSYDGEMSQEVLRYFNDYITNNRTTYEITTTLATYSLSETSYAGGDIIRAKVAVYPLNAPNVKITYDINVGNPYPYITAHRIDIDYQIEYNRFRNENI